MRSVAGWNCVPRKRMNKCIKEYLNCSLPFWPLQIALQRTYTPIQRCTLTRPQTGTEGGRQPPRDASHSDAFASYYTCTHTHTLEYIPFELALLRAQSRNYAPITRMTVHFAFSHTAAAAAAAANSLSISITHESHSTK